MKRVLILEPYYGGSHKHFLEGLQKHVTADYLIYTLPPRNWKMRMQLSAPWFVEQIKAQPVSDKYFDSVLCSSFIDVSVLRCLLLQVNGWNKSARFLTYFHENQFVYPQQFEQPSNHHFMSVNFHSALTSDSIAFNSVYNRESFFDGCRKSLNSATDMKFSGVLEALSGKSQILSPGIDFSEIDKIPWKKSIDIPVIVWNHRWEHDKNPERFFLALEVLEECGVDFRLIVLGQSFNGSPECFSRAQQKYKDKIIHYGFVESYQEYIWLLSKGDIVVSTSLHEFYGISIIEAVRAGCTPILPDRLSYPELFEKKFLYSDDLLAEHLGGVINKQCRLPQATARAMTDQFSWQSLQKSYSEWL